MKTPIKKDIAVIVPVYNVEQYLASCIDSLLEQSFKGYLQIILVNDCSPDNSHKICLSYSKKYPDVISYIQHTENQGSAVARNSGLETINADFFAFVDPDDIVTHNAFFTLYKEITESGSDIVKGNSLSLSSSKLRPANYNVAKEKIINDHNCLSEFLSHKNVRGHPWGKIFRTQSLGHIRFTPGYSMAQDLLYCAEAFSQCNKLKLIPEIVYQYRIHSGGATGNKYHTKAYRWWFKAVENTQQFCQTQQQFKQYKNLQVRTLLQAIHEVKELEGELKKSVLKDLEQQRINWHINFKSILFKNGFCAKSIFRYLRYLKELTFIT